MSLKFADYAKPETDELEQELEQVEEKKRDIPESVVKRFDGKPIEDILESYANLERKFSEQGETVGRMRKTVDQLLELQSQSPAPSKEVTPEKADDPVDIDDLYENTEEAIAKVADKRVGKRIEDLESKLAKQEAEKRVAALSERYDGWIDEVKSDDFRSWVQSSNYRSRLAQAADSYDFDAANDLLEMWYDRKQEEQKVEEKVKREKKLRDATLESSSPAGVSVPQTYSRSELLEKRIAAKMGDPAAERYLRAHADSIAIAYEEGRVTD